MKERLKVFGNINSESIKHLEFVLQSIQGERGHRLEAMHNDPQLIKAEDHIQKALNELVAYQRRSK